MKKRIVKTALVLLVLGGSILGGAGSTAAATNRMCFGPINMSYNGPTAGGAPTNLDMVQAMSVDNPNGNAGMKPAVTTSLANVSQTPACQP